MLGFSLGRGLGGSLGGGGTPSLVNPILAFEDLNIFVDMTNGEKTFDGSELTAVAAAAGDLTEINEIEADDHAIWNADAFGGKGGMELLAATRMQWGTFTSSPTRSLMFTMEFPDPMPGGAQALSGWLNSSFGSVNSARFTFSIAGRVQYGINSTSTLVNLSDVIVAGSKHILLAEFDSGVCNVYLDDFSTPFVTFIPNTNYEPRVRFNLGALSSSDAAFPELVYGDVFMKKTWLTEGERTAVFNYYNTYYELGL